MKTHTSKQKMHNQTSFVEKYSGIIKDKNVTAMGMLKKYGLRI
ncbi:MAG: hypothetical protein Q7S92_01750 [Candidatus Diapherotrites archaeon]|nr:hypothetical protein [Candidatus Diapherotrites archaeon]